MSAAMNNRERYLATVRFQETDRPMHIEAIGIDDDTVARWKKEGWEPMTEPVNFMAEFNMDIAAPAFFGAHLHPGFWPLFEEKVIKDDGRRQLVQTQSGAMLERFSDGGMTIPHFVSFPVKTIADLEKLMPRLDPGNRERVDVWKWSFDMARNVKWPLFVYCSGCFGFHRHLMGFEELMAAYVLDPELIHAMSAAWEALVIGILERCRAHGPIDALLLWEDMCYKNGPMISPQMFKEYILPYYKRVSAKAYELGAAGVHVDTDGDCTLLIPLFMEGGVNWLEPFEVQAGMDVRVVRKNHPRLVIHGGLDKRTLAVSKKAIDAELSAKLKFMLDRGGYVPSIDHVVPPDVPLENWLYFLDRVRSG
jgi:uroporphyrinogen decarboxylase